MRSRSELVDELSAKLRLAHQGATPDELGLVKRRAVFRMRMHTIRDQVESHFAREMGVPVQRWRYLEYYCRKGLPAPMADGCMLETGIAYGTA